MHYLAIMHNMHYLRKGIMHIGNTGKDTKLYRPTAVFDMRQGYRAVAKGRILTGKRYAV
jgi:hypothetical protein